MLAILGESVKSDLALSDRELGALTGPAFSIVYALLGLLFGRLADHLERRRLVVIGALIWSVASMAGALASGYPALVAARAGVALGEAIGTAATVSLMAVVAGARYRARAMSFFAACAFAGAGLAAILGGAVASVFASARIAGWRAALIAAGIPGMAGALYLWWLPATEPARHGTASRRVLPASMLVLVAGVALLTILLQMEWRPEMAVPVSVAAALLAGAGWMRNLRATDRDAYRNTFGNPAYRWLLLAFSAGLFVDCAAEFWLFPYAQRRFGLDAARVGADLGTILIVAGIGGSLAGGWIADYWRRTAAAGRAWTAVAALVAETIAILCALSQPSYPALMCAFAAVCAAAGAWVGVAAAIGLDILPRHRGTGTAAYFLITTLMGPGLGPFLVGLQSDRSGSLSHALALSTVLMAVAIVGLLRLGRLTQSQ